MTKGEPVWVGVDQVLRVHRLAVAGQAALRDRRALEGALGRPLHAWRYTKPNLFELAALYAEGIAKAHPFVDGNKRAALSAAVLFLFVNGHRLQAPDRQDELAGLIEDIAADGQEARAALSQFFQACSTR